MAKDVRIAKVKLREIEARASARVVEAQQRTASSAARTKQAQRLGQSTSRTVKHFLFIREAFNFSALDRTLNWLWNSVHLS